MIGRRLNRSLTASGLAVGPLSSADIIALMECSDAPPVQPVLKTWLLRAWHRLWTIVRWLHRCLFLPHRFNRCLKVDLAWFHSSLRNEPTWRRRFFRHESDASMFRHRLNRCCCFTVELVQFIVFFEFFLRVLLCMCFLLYFWDLQMFTQQNH